VSTFPSTTTNSGKADLRRVLVKSTVGDDDDDDSRWTSMKSGRADRRRDL
jgi:hypothetical protein